MTNNLALLNAIFDEYKNENFPDEDNRDYVFNYFVIDSLYRKYDISDDEIKKGLIKGKKDWGIDGFYLYINEKFINSEEELKSIVVTRNFVIDLDIIQFKNKESFEESVINKFITVAPYIVELDKINRLEYNAISPDLRDFIQLFHQCLKKFATKFPIINIRFIHASRGDSKVVNGPKRKNISYMQKVEDLSGIIKENELGKETNFEYKLMGIDELKNLAQFQKSYSGTLKVNQNPIYVEYVNQHNKQDQNKQKGYIATAFIRDYFDFLIENTDDNNPSIRDYLFDSNIRDYQNKTEVNRGIENTLNTKDDNEDFWWLNNGITILADDGSLQGNSFTLDNIQIVNGLQTSYSIYNILKDNKNRELENRSIFCKIIITQEDESRDSIIRATNSQNTVPSSSLRSTDNLQRDIEAFFNKHDLYYDRRKNYYKNHKKPRNKIISINYLAQALTSILERKPSKARNSPTVLTKKDEDYKKIFNENINIEVYYYAAFLRKKLEFYMKNNFVIKNEMDDAISNYFKLHVLRILSSLLLNKEKVTAKDMSTLNIDIINNIADDMYDKSIKLITSVLNKESAQGKINFANISKKDSLDSNIDTFIKEYIKNTQVSNNK